MERVDYESLIVQDLLNFSDNKSLNVSPWYQRRSVWSKQQKAYLINTIFEKKPVPSIYIRHHIDFDREVSVKEVVDGQQRIRAVLSYRAGEFAARHPDHGRPVFYSDLSRADRASFLTTALSVGYLIGADDRDVVEIFGRINSVLKTLNPQEKRNAIYSGEFKQFCLREASSRLPVWRSTQIFSANDIARMQEVQFVSDLVINLIDGVVDFSPAKINSYYKKFDEKFPHEEDVKKRVDALFDLVVTLDSGNFSDTVFRSSEITLTLLVALDELGPRHVSVERIAEVMRGIDRELGAATEGRDISEEEAATILSFSGGNLHRIKKRQGRKDILINRLR